MKNISHIQLQSSFTCATTPYHKTNLTPLTSVPFNETIVIHAH